MFFGDRATALNDLMASRRAIISGSVALFFFLWTDNWTPGDIDIYVAVDTYDHFVCDLERSGFAILDVDMGSWSQSTYHGIRRVRRYVTAAGERLDVIQSTDGNPATPLTSFWSSVVVNFLTPHGAASAFPVHTLDHVALVTNTIESGKLLAAQDKYKARGFQFVVANGWAPVTQPVGEPGRVISVQPILAVDFASVWSADPYTPPLPVRRVGPGWVLTVSPSAF
uniref:Adhesin glycosyltransferase n=1 Tax=Ganoderma boninense TaxID=34458 RepID=A0A5K1K1Q4_9APHY|nr:Putative adhesin glycosyltransferase [Ganoderma boninense]